MPDMPAIAIDRRDEGNRGRYAGIIDGVEGEAQLLFTRRSADLLSADHAEAPMSMRDVEGTSHVWVRFKQLDEK